MEQPTLAQPTLSLAAPKSLIKRKYTDGALHSGSSGGKKAAAGEQTGADYRTPFMRDRDRVLYCTAFRRLAGKTQIYTIGNDDHRRNRLTHTLEVAQIARTIACALQLDCDLAEAIALAHDLGHTPFGHAGEKVLHKIMSPQSPVIQNSPLFKCSLEDLKARVTKERPSKKFDINKMMGFKHNLQSVRVATVLEDSYRDEKGHNIGLGLTNYTLWGMMNHSALQYADDSFAPNYQNQFFEQMTFPDSAVEAWSLEAYVVKIADDIAQCHHDLEDALRGDAMSTKKIHTTLSSALNGIVNKEDKEILKTLKNPKVVDRKYTASLSHVVVNSLVSDVVSASRKKMDLLRQQLREKNGEIEDLFLNYDKYNKYIEISEEKEKDSNKKTVEKSIPKNEVICFSKKEIIKDIKIGIQKFVHHSQAVERMNGKGDYIIRKIFEAYCSHPQQLPDGPIIHYMVEIGKYKNIDIAKATGRGEIRKRFGEDLETMTAVKQLALMRRICDHIASMTDHYAINEYNSLYG